MILRRMALAVILACVMMFPVSVEAKIYIWTDKNSQTHYCNDPDDVPKDYKDNCRIIESQAARSASSPERTTAQASQPSITPPAPPSQRQGEMEELLKEYREKRKAMQEYRKSNKNFQTPEYEELKQQLNELKLQLTQKRQHHAAPK